MHGEPLRFVPGHENRGRSWSEKRRAEGQPKLRGKPRPEAVRRKISEHHKAAGIRPSAEATKKSNENRARREQSPLWRGGISIVNGYRCERLAEHPRAHSNGSVYEHILIAERGLGRFLFDGEVVHHKDGDKKNNDPQNLVVFASQAEHVACHRARGDMP